MHESALYLPTYKSPLPPSPHPRGKTRQGSGNIKRLDSAGPFLSIGKNQKRISQAATQKTLGDYRRELKNEEEG